MAKVVVTKAKLETLADAVRRKAGVSGKKTIDELTQAVDGINVGTNTADATGGAEQMLAGYTAYGAGGKFTGAIESFSGWEVAPSAMPTTIKGRRYLASDMTIKAARLQDRTVKPTTSRQTISKTDAACYGLGTVTVEGAKLQACSVTPKDTEQNITPSGDNIGFSSVHVEPIKNYTKFMRIVMQGGGGNGLRIPNTDGFTSIFECSVLSGIKLEEVTESGVVLAAFWSDGKSLVKQASHNGVQAIVTYNENLSCAVGQDEIIMMSSLQGTKFSGPLVVSVYGR